MRELLVSPDHERSRSLGWLALAWIEHFVIHGPGDIQGATLRDIPLSDELAGHTLDVYALGDDGRRLYDSVFFSRPKGADKSGHAARIGLFEGMGPCRFAGWARGGEVFEWMDFRYVYEPGEPMGRPVTYPFLRCMATEEGQTGNVYDSIYYNLREGPLRESLRHADDAGLTRVYLPGGGEIRPSTASSASKDGGKETWADFDEALALDTPLPTPTGWTSMGAVEVGDLLLGADGRSVRVIKVTDVMERRDCYRVTFADGSSVVASAGHQWFARHRADMPARIWTTEEMCGSGHTMRVPASAPWQLPEVDHNIDPYVLGLWLGDGDARNATITAGESDVSAVMELIEASGYTARRISASGGRSPRLYVSMPGSHRNRYSSVTGLKRRLHDAGLLGAKRIPESYLRGSIDQRLSLLQGLMDSDGHATKAGDCTFVNTSPLLVDGIVELLRSLGEVPTVRFVPDTRSRAGGYFQVHFTARFVNPFRLARKAERVKLSGFERSRWTTIRSIDPVASVPVRCVAVDASDHLFLAGRGAHVTHNTHLYILPELRRMYATVRRNMAKRKDAEPWSYETSTMYEVGRESVAEQSHKLAQMARKDRKLAPRFLFDHRQAPTNVDMSNDEAVTAALREAYGGADYMPFDRILGEIRDPRNDIADSVRYFFNQANAASEAAFDLVHWRSLLRKDYTPENGTLITLGFDGARRRDSTALVATEVETGFQWLVKEWAMPAGAESWSVDEQDVDATVAEVFRTYEVWRMYCDPPYWENTIARWAGQYGDKVVVSFSTNSPRRMSPAVQTFAHAIREGVLSHNGDERLATAIGNAKRENLNFYDDEGRPLWVFGKMGGKDSPNKIDAAVAACLSWQARTDAIADGAQARPMVTGFFV